MKACPGLRSGIDCSDSLSFAIRGIPSSIRPPIRHLYENAPTRLSSAPLNPSIPRHPFVNPAPQFVIPAKAGIQRGGAGCGNDARTLPPTNAP